MRLSVSRWMRSTGPKGRRDPLSFLPVPVSAADYPAVGWLLTSVFASRHANECSADEFKASINDPFHELHDRLVIKCGSQLVGHALTTRRTMQFGSIRLPAAGLHWLGVEPAFRSGGLGMRLLAAAENLMADQGGLIGLIRTQIPHFFRRTGWALCGHHSHSRAGAHDIIAEMIARDLRPGLLRDSLRGLRGRSCKKLLQGSRRKRLRIRCWRRMEIPALLRIYDRNTLGMSGPLERTAAYWQWLVNRRGYDRLYVALDGPDLFELDETRTHIVGYAAIRGGQILELMAEPGGETGPRKHSVLVKLLARACDDAIEQGHNYVTYHGHPQDCLHDLFTAAGGTHHREARDDNGEVLMARLLRPSRVLDLLAPELHARLQAGGDVAFAKTPMPGRLSLNVDGRRYVILIGRKGVAVQTGRMAIFGAANHAGLNVADFTRLVLGQFDWTSPLSESSIRVSTPATAVLLRLLFPPLPLWRPPLDDATAR